MIRITIENHDFDVEPWNYGQKQEAVRKATKFKKFSEDFEVDPWLLNDLMVVTCVKRWTLLDEDGISPLPITLEGIKRARPPEIIEALINELHKLNSVSPSERKKLYRQ